MTYTELKQIAEWGEQGVLQARCGLRWEDYGSVWWTFDHEEPFGIYRRRPEKKLRPWTPNEVPVGALITAPGHYAGVILGVTHDGLVRTFFSSYDRERLLNEGVVYSLDQGKTWLPCGVEERK